MMTQVKSLEVLSIIVTVRSQVLCHLITKTTCGLKSLTLQIQKS